MLADLADVVPADVEAYLGRYTNDALGEIELRLDGDALVLDAGECIELLANHSEDAEEGNEYVIFEHAVGQLNADIR
ncbi:MAG: hypothetical protein R2856_07250 [Caldilineaceae bacterium]